jgi:hypothetical protein
MDRPAAAKITDLDSYLFAIFPYRLNRYLAQELKRRQIIEFVAGKDELGRIPQSGGPYGN